MCMCNYFQGRLYKVYIQKKVKLYLVQKATTNFPTRPVIKVGKDPLYIKENKNGKYIYDFN